MKLDRALQRDLLTQMSEKFPDPAKINDPDPDRSHIRANLAYLEEHGLSKSKQIFEGVGMWHRSTITAAGLDFLANDGGLTAILGVVTVRLHADTLRALIQAKIDASDLAPEKKLEAKGLLKRLSEKGLETAMGELVRQGIAHVPDLMGWLHHLTTTAT